MKAFVAGATGVLGHRTISRLVATGAHVTGIARTPDKADLLDRLGATPAEVSLFDPDGLAAAVAGHDVVINLATAIPTGERAGDLAAWDENDRIRREGARNLVDAALDAGAARYVQESITLLYADGRRRRLARRVGAGRADGHHGLRAGRRGRGRPLRCDGGWRGRGAALRLPLRPRQRPHRRGRGRGPFGRTVRDRPARRLPADRGHRRRRRRGDRRAGRAGRALQHRGRPPADTDRPRRRPGPGAGRRHPSRPAARRRAATPGGHARPLTAGDQRMREGWPPVLAAL